MIRWCLKCSLILTYRKLQYDPTREILNLLDHIFLEGISLGVTDDKERDHTLIKHPVCPIIQALPKTHKNVFPPPMRPIISGMDSLTENICMWLDSLLQLLIS